MSTMVLDNANMLGEVKEGVKEVFASKVSQITSLLNEAEKVATADDEFGYILPNLRELTEMMADCEQYDLELDGEAVMVDRVFKLNRYVPKGIMHIHNVRSAMLGGMFVIMPCFLLPAEKVNKAKKNRYKSVLNPEEFGLPSNDVANYATIKQLNSSVYVCLAKMPNAFYSDYITTAKHYDYIFMN